MDIVPTSNLWRNANRLAQGKLADVIREARRNETSWSQLVGILASDYGIEVSDQTLINWATRLGIDTQRMAS